MMLGKMSITKELIEAKNDDEWKKIRDEIKWVKVKVRLW